MSKYITHFQTESEYQTALPTIELPNVSLVDELGEVHYHRALYGANAGDICLYDVAEGQKFFVTANNWNLTSYPTASYPIVGIAIADESVTGVTLVSTFFMAADGSATRTSTILKWQDVFFDWGLTKYTSENEAKTDFNGKTNTSTIINAIKAYDLAHSTDNLTGHIGGAIQEFYVTGTNKGDWYVGAAGEVAYFVTNKTKLNATFNKIYSQQYSLITGDSIANNESRATSTEYSNQTYWRLGNYSSGFGTSQKSVSGLVRPFTIV